MNRIFQISLGLLVALILGGLLFYYYFVRQIELVQVKHVDAQRAEGSELQNKLGIEQNSMMSEMQDGSIDEKSQEDSFAYEIIKKGNGKKIDDIWQEMVVKYKIFEKSELVDEYNGKISINWYMPFKKELFLMDEESVFRFIYLWEYKKDNIEGEYKKVESNKVVEIELVDIIDSNEYEEVMDHELKGKVYTLPWFGIYTDKYIPGHGVYTNVNGITRHLHFPRTNSAGNVYDNLDYYQNMEPDIKYVLPGSEITIKKIFKKVGRDYHQYILEDENGVESHFLDFIFEDVLDVNAYDNSYGVDQLLTKAIKNNEEYFTVELHRSDLFDGSQQWYGLERNIWNNPYTAKKEKGELTVKEFERILYKKYKKKVIDANYDYSVVKVKLDFDQLLFLTLFGSENLIRKIYINSERSVEDVTKEVVNKEEEEARKYGEQDLWRWEKEIEGILVAEQPMYFDKKGNIRVEESFFEKRKSWDTNSKNIKHYANLLNEVLINYSCEIITEDINKRIATMKKINDCMPEVHQGIKDEGWELMNVIEDKYRWTKHKDELYPFYGMCDNFCKE